MAKKAGRWVWALTFTAMVLHGYFMSRPAAAGVDRALGQYLSGECVGCHQLSGEATAGIPAIIGLPVDAFIAALTAYKTGKRNNPVMRNIADRLTTEEMAALAVYFATVRQ